jgi:hypothetical protein
MACGNRPCIIRAEDLKMILVVARWSPRTRWLEAGRYCRCDAADGRENDCGVKPVMDGDAKPVE